jgi:hypothetical protein
MSYIVNYSKWRRIYEAETTQLSNETLDTTELNAALAELNGLLKTIPTTNKEPNSYDQYVTSGYFFSLYSVSLALNYNGKFSTDLELGDKGIDSITKKDPYTSATTAVPRSEREDEGITRIPAQHTGLALRKNDPAMVFNINQLAQTILGAEPADTEIYSNFIDKHVKDFNTAIQYLHKKDQQIAMDVAAQLSTKLTNVSNAMVNVMSKIPKQKMEAGWSWRSLNDIRKLVMNTTAQGITLELQLQGGVSSLR